MIISVRGLRGGKVPHTIQTNKIMYAQGKHIKPKTNREFK